MLEVRACAYGTRQCVVPKVVWWSGATLGTPTAPRSRGSTLPQGAYVMGLYLSSIDK